MDFVVTKLDGLTKAELAGRLDTANVNNAETYFTASILPKAQPTVLDLSQVSFIASLGIRMLLSTARGLNRRGAKFILFGPSPEVMEILETTALSEIIPVFETEAEAIAAAAG